MGTKKNLCTVPWVNFLRPPSGQTIIISHGQLLHENTLISNVNVISEISPIITLVCNLRKDLRLGYQEGILFGYKEGFPSWLPSRISFLVTKKDLLLGYQERSPSYQEPEGGTGPARKVSKHVFGYNLGPKASQKMIFSQNLCKILRGIRW